MSDIVLGREVLFADETNYKKQTLGESFAVSRDLLKSGHTHIRGRTRSGKTSLALTPLIRSACDHDPHTPEAVAVFDLGGSVELYHLAQAMAKSRNKPFRLFCLDDTRDWDYFDPFAMARGNDRVIRICTMLVEAFSLDHGLVYGGSYFTAKAVDALLRVATKVMLESNKGHQLNIDDIVQYLEKSTDRDEAGPRMALKSLSEYPQLKPPPGKSDRTINFERVLENGEFVYFYLPTLGEATTARQIAGLGLYTLIQAAMRRQELGMPERHVHCFVDEFQELAGPSFARLLAHSAKSGVSITMANQTTSQLIAKDLRLDDAVRDNTLMKMYFTCVGPEIEDLQGFSSEDTNFYLNQTGGLASNSFRQQIVPLLRRGKIQEVSGRNQQCFIILDDGAGHREPTPVRLDYLLDRENFEKFKRKPLPPYTGTHRQTRHEVIEEMQLPLWQRLRSSDRAKSQHDALQRLLNAKRRCSQTEGGTV